MISETTLNYVTNMLHSTEKTIAGLWYYRCERDTDEEYNLDMTFSHYSPSELLLLRPSERGKSRLDDNLDGGAAVHLVESLLVVLELEGICDHALDIYLAAIKVGNRARETVGLREGADDLENDTLAGVAKQASMITVP